MKQMQSTRKLTLMGIMVALSIILVYTVRFPIIPAAPYLEYEPGDIPIFIVTFLYGPLSGLLTTIVVSVVQGITVSASSGIIGIIMHIFATGSYVLVAGNIYKLKKNRSNEIISLLSGIAIWVLSMCFWNIIFTPIFEGFPREAIVKMLLPVFVPFNLIKAGINSIITFFVYETIVTLILKNR